MILRKREKEQRESEERERGDEREQRQGAERLREIGKELFVCLCLYVREREG